MSNRSIRVFCVHSKSRPLQAKFYDALHDSLQGLDIALTHYDDWSWETPGGKSDEDVEREERIRANEYREGYRDIRGMGWVKNPPAELSLILGKRHAPAPSAFNESDLSRLLSTSHCLIFVEDEHQTEVSEGVHSELQLLREHEKRLLNVRLYGKREDAYLRSVYTFSDALRVNGVVGISAVPEDDIPQEDIELITFIVSMWCDDSGGPKDLVHQQGQPRVAPGFDRCPVGLGPRDLYRYKTVVRLATADRVHIRQAALLYMAGSRSTELRHELCRFLADLFRHDGSWQRHFSDFDRFMELTPDIDWSPIIREMSLSLKPNVEYLVQTAEVLSGIVTLQHTSLDGKEGPLGSELLAGLRSVPRWAVVGFAAHCARSSWTLYSWPGMSRRQADQLNRTILLAESAASEARLLVQEVVSWSSVDMCRERLAALAIAATAAAAFASAACSYESAGQQQIARKLDETARRLVSRIVSNAFSEYGVKRMTEHLGLVASMATDRGWQDTSPIPAEVFSKEP